MILGSSAITSGIQNGPSAFTSGIHIGLRNHWFLLDVRELECPRLDSSVLDLPNLGFGKRLTNRSLNIQTRMCDIFAPLTVAWAAVEGNTSGKEVIQFLQVAITLLGDASNNVSSMRWQRLTGHLPNKCLTSLLWETATSRNLLLGESCTKFYKIGTQEIDVFHRSSAFRQSSAFRRSSGSHCQSIKPSRLMQLGLYIKT